MMDLEIEFTFFVPGAPVPQGSKNAAVVRKRGKNGNYTELNGARGYRAVMFEQERGLKPWREAIASTAKRKLPDNWSLNGEFAVYCAFFFLRPNYHYNKDRELKSEYKNVFYKTTKPDGDKCLRAVNDAITGIAFEDDATVVSGSGLTLWADPGLPGALITVGRLRGNPVFLRPNEPDEEL